ncbi:DgyrCDS815 [Dimorphilus gyrociliatus]|uniref:DgyrCDS815 n=1 Tax=Dimorphilus gyrociliatus TaxID=2664684 RepID=A0A7I8V6Z5_9ANNE|nr:DgyrCDS815 [Dimorphilus gyrociliatus]
MCWGAGAVGAPAVGNKVVVALSNAVVDEGICKAAPCAGICPKQEKKSNMNVSHRSFLGVVATPAFVTQHWSRSS